MLLRMMFAMVLVCVGSMCMCVRADTGSRVSLSKDYGVKLCGREFIRAVIFTCGGSRWRRSIDDDMSDDLTGDHDQLTWQQGLELASAGATENHSPPKLPSDSSAYSLADLLAIFGRLGDPRQMTGDQHLLEGLQQSAVSGGVELGRGEADLNWPSASRRKRNFSLGVAGMCCNQGCTKNDIGRLC
ncbi:prorelaxin H1 [Aplochiton taeniatus]